VADQKGGDLADDVLAMATEDEVAASLHADQSATGSGGRRWAVAVRVLPVTRQVT
jgi:hypothetical protein